MVADTLTYEDFEPHLGSAFTVISEDVPSTTFTLTEAKQLKSMQNIERPREPFSLLFEAPAPLFPQRLYSFSHGALGEREIFIVPIAKVENGFQYEAIFN
ncbi:MAG: hypothetical protein ABI471_01840 [Sphingomonas bacterium]